MTVRQGDMRWNGLRRDDVQPVKDPLNWPLQSSVQYFIKVRVYVITVLKYARYFVRTQDLAPCIRGDVRICCINPGFLFMIQLNFPNHASCHTGRPFSVFAVTNNYLYLFHQRSLLGTFIIDCRVKDVNTCPHAFQCVTVLSFINMIIRVGGGGGVC